MTTTQAHSSFVINLRDKIEYPNAGVLSQVLMKDRASQMTLFCLATETDISEHTSTRNATIYVLEGHGMLTLDGRDIVLETGKLVFMPANAPHALKADANLAFVLILSE